MLEVLFIAILLGVIEGATEFLPVSSTGHMLLAGHWLGYTEQDPFWKMFIIFIQIGAIVAVVVYFRQRITQLLQRQEDLDLQASGGSAAATVRLSAGPVVLVAAATVPVLAVGFLVQDWVDAVMGSPIAIALALGIGGVVMLAVEALPLRPTVHAVEQISLRQAFLIGLAQILAVVFPGVSRSAATIVGGLALGLSRTAAAEFSFFLAIPALFAACGYSLLKQLTSAAGLTVQQAIVLFVGTLVSFAVAWAVIALFMNYIRRHNFVPFAVYRIGLGVAVYLLST